MCSARLSTVACATGACRVGSLWTLNHGLFHAWPLLLRAEMSRVESL